jgi:hypothetical protein
MNRFLYALMVCAAISLAPITTQAQRLVHDSRYSSSQPWIAFSNSAPGANRVEVILDNVRADCTDPVAGRALPPNLFCAQTNGIAHVLVHLFESQNGTQVRLDMNGAAMVCTASQCRATFSVPASAQFGLLIHGGSTARGRITGTVRVVGVRDGVPPIDLLPARGFDFTGHIMTQLPPRLTSPFDLHGVLMPDGALYNADGELIEQGNMDNDFLGVDATELWLLDTQLAVIAADLAQTGVGPAGKMTRREIAGLARNPRWAVMRPWSQPPFPLRVDGRELRVDTRKYPRP